MTDIEQRHINMIRYEFAKRGFIMSEEAAKSLWDMYLGQKYKKDFTI